MSGDSPPNYDPKRKVESEIVLFFVSAAAATSLVPAVLQSRGHAAVATLRDWPASALPCLIFGVRRRVFACS